MSTRNFSPDTVKLFETYLILFILVLLTSCAKTKSSSAAKVQLVLKAVNSNTVAQAHALRAVRSELAPESNTATNTNNGQAGSILSGPPEKMVVYLEAIAGIKADNSSETFWTSPDAGGSAISLQSGAADVSALGIDNLSIPVGDYSGLVLVFARVGQIKGCVQGHFGMTTTQQTGTFDGSSHHGGNLYTNEAVTAGQAITACTRADLSELGAETFSTDIIGHNADYDPAQNGKSDSELVDLDLAGGNPDLTIAEVRKATIPVISPVTFSAKEGVTQTLTIGVDLNRMLRFYANTRPDHQPPNPEMKAGTSYFFSTLFDKSILAFAGDVGSVQGYQMTASNGGSSVEGWMTIFLDASGKLLSGLVMPDDDDALTILKGNATLSAGALDTGADLALDISKSTIQGFIEKELSASGSCQLKIDADSQSSEAGKVYSLEYERLL